jgi:hypothetical protein
MQRASPERVIIQWTGWHLSRAGFSNFARLPPHCRIALLVNQGGYEALLDRLDPRAASSARAMTSRRGTRAEFVVQLLKRIAPARFSAVHCNVSLDTWEAHVGLLCLLIAEYPHWVMTAAEWPVVDWAASLRGWAHRLETASLLSSPAALQQQMRGVGLLVRALHEKAEEGSSLARAATSKVLAVAAAGSELFNIVNGAQTLGCGALRRHGQELDAVFAFYSIDSWTSASPRCVNLTEFLNFCKDICVPLSASEQQLIYFALGSAPGLSADQFKSAISRMGCLVMSSTNSDAAVDEFVRRSVLPNAHSISFHHLGATMATCECAASLAKHRELQRLNRAAASARCYCECSLTRSAPAAASDCTSLQESRRLIAGPGLALPNASVDAWLR